MKPSGFPDDIPILKLVATYETRSRLRVKITDAENERYEVNVLKTSDHLKDKKPAVDDLDYIFELNTDIPGFSVSRKSNREVCLRNFP